MYQANFILSICIPMTSHVCTSIARVWKLNYIQQTFNNPQNLYQSVMYMQTFLVNNVVIKPIIFSTYAFPWRHLIHVCTWMARVWKLKYVQQTFKNPTKPILASDVYGEVIFKHPKFKFTNTAFIKAIWYETCHDMTSRRHLVFPIIYNINL